MKIPIKNFIKFYTSAKTVYNIHSPFVFEFVNEIMDTGRVFYDFNTIESTRKQLLASNEIIEFLDLGAGGVDRPFYKKKVKEVAKSSLSSVTQCRMLFNLINHYKTKNILEMGTSLGISSMYLASPDSRNQVVTLEGNPASARMSKRSFARNKYDNIDVIEGAFKDTLEIALKKLGSVDLAFIDGNHRYEPTMKYFKEILPFCNEDSILVFDDIYWSDEMMGAWEELKEQPEVTLSIDLFFMGILFFKKINSQQKHHRLIQRKYKPLSLGIFG